MEDLDTPQLDAEADGFSLIDVSASDDDDFLLASSSDVSIVDNPGYAEGVPKNQPSDSLSLHIPRKTGKCNLRKSLAWDSAFFTNAGVLDPEELSSIIEGADTSVKPNSFLPGIQEDLSKSTDSISTFHSDLTLESLEADLFCDIRASIQRCSKSSSTGNSSGSKIHGKEVSVNSSSARIVEPSRKLAKPKSVFNKLDSGVQRPVRTSKPGSVRKQEKPPVNRSREPSSLLSRPLKAAGEPSLQVAATTKRMSVSAGSVKADSNAVGNVKGSGINSRKPLPKALVLSKSPAASSVLNRTTTRSSRSSCDSTSSSVSENVRKSQTGVIKRKIDKNVTLPSGSKTRTSAKVVEKVKYQNTESRLSAYVKSPLSLSPSISPASSISEWSTESSSSTATIGQKHFGFNSCPPSSQDVTVDCNVSQNMHNLSSDRVLGGHSNQVPGILSHSAKEPSTGSVASNTRPGFAKPSGLRMPSPNIGFFDGVKAGTRTPSSSSRSRPALPGSLPRSLAGTNSPAGTTNKTKLGTSASKMTAAAAGTAKSKQRNPDANLKTPARVLEHSVDLENPSVKHIDNDSEISSEFSSIPSKSALKRNKKSPEASDVGKCAPDSQLVGDDKLASNLVTVGSVETLSEFQSSISPKSALERSNEVLEASDIGNHVPNSRMVGLDNLTDDFAAVSTEEGPKLDPQIFDANLESVACMQDHSVGLQSQSSFSELPKSTSKLALEKEGEFAEVTFGGKLALDLASVAIDNLIASEKEASLKGKFLNTVDLENVTVKDQLKTDPQSPDLDLMPSAQLQGASRTKDTDDDYGTSPVSALESISEVTDGKYSLPDVGSAVKDDLIASEIEGILHFDNLGTVASEDGSSILDATHCIESSCASPHPNTEQINRNNRCAVYNLTSSQQVNEGDNLTSVSQYTQQDKDGSVGSEASNENTCLENQAVQMEDAYAENQGQGYSCHVEPRDHKVEEQEESDKNMQSDSEQFASLISNISPSSCQVVDPATRTPFAVKNSESNFLEVSDSPTELAAESFSKVDALSYSSLEKSLKENS